MHSRSTDHDRTTREIVTSPSVTTIRVRAASTTVQPQPSPSSPSTGQLAENPRTAPATRAAAASGIQSQRAATDRNSVRFPTPPPDIDPMKALGKRATSVDVTRVRATSLGDRQHRAEDERRLECGGPRADGCAQMKLIGTARLLGHSPVSSVATTSRSCSANSGRTSVAVVCRISRSIDQ